MPRTRMEFAMTDLLVNETVTTHETPDNVKVFVAPGREGSFVSLKPRYENFIGGAWDHSQSILPFVHKWSHVVGVVVDGFAVFAPARCQLVTAHLAAIDAQLILSQP